MKPIAIATEISKTITTAKVIGIFLSAPATSLLEQRLLDGFYASILLKGGKAEGRTTAEAAGGHSICRFRWLSPIPFAGLPAVAGDPALYHFVAPMVACDNEGSQVFTAEAKRTERRDDNQLQQLIHRELRFMPFLSPNPPRRA